jgi:hypothetical protein
MSAIAKDFQAAVEIMEERIPLAGWEGSGKPEIGEEGVRFNGVEKCGHKERDLGIAWPDDNAGGVQMQPELSGERWFAGVLLQSRTCSGDCSHEPMNFPRVMKPKKWDTPKEDGLFFVFCKTAFKPYDFAVCVFLVIARHYLLAAGEPFRVNSDGKEKHWDDAKMFCQYHFDYDMSKILKEEDE